MKKRIRKARKIVLYGIVIALMIYGIYYTNNTPCGFYDIANVALAIFIAYPINSFVTAIKDCADNTVWKEQLQMYMRKQMIKKTDTIRISFAYLFRIKVDDKYLLVLNGRGTGKYQPVGGAYKLYEREKQYLKDEFHVSGDNKMPLDSCSKNDYRMFVPAEKLKAFVKRFCATSDREQIENLSREFREELIKTEILSENFGNIKYRYCGRYFTGIEFSRHFQCYELLLADIVEVLLTTEQENKLREMMIMDERYRFATKYEIEHCGIDENAKKYKEEIADHTFKILEETEQYLDRRARSSRIYEFEL